MKLLPSGFRSHHAFLGLVIGVLMTACSGNLSEVSTITLPPTQSSTVSQVTGTPTSTQPGLEEFGLTMEQLVTHVEGIEALIAKCMNDAGFEYIAVDFITVRQGMLADKASPGLTQREFKSLYGFGISTLYADVDVPQRAADFVPAKSGWDNRMFKSSMRSLLPIRLLTTARFLAKTSTRRSQ